MKFITDSVCCALVCALVLLPKARAADAPAAGRRSYGSEPASDNRALVGLGRRVAVVAAFHGTPIASVIDGARNEAYRSSFDAPRFYGVGAAFRYQFSERLGIEAGARYEILTGVVGERLLLERGFSFPARLPILLAAWERHGIELIPELSYQFVWSEQEDDDLTSSRKLRISGAGVGLALGYNLMLVDKLSLRFELGFRGDGGEFTNGHGDFAGRGRGRVSIPLGVALEYELRKLP